MKVTEKRFKHGCDKCEWRFQSGEYDMYFCPNAESDLGGSVIAREGDEGGDYISYPLAILFRPVVNEDLRRSNAFRACSKVAFDLHMSGRIKLRFEVLAEEDLVEQVKITSKIVDELIAEEKDEYAAIPPLTRAALGRWVKERRPPGHFVLHLLKNDLHAAVISADSNNAAALATTVLYMHRHLPSDCWGSEEAVEKWEAGR